jgi:NitT/TauT family transport system permease protein
MPRHAIVTIPAPGARAWLRLRPVLLPLALGLALFAAWDWSVRVLKVSPVLLPRPGPVLQSITGNFALLREHGAHTLGEALAAVALSSIIGVLVAFLLSTSRRVRAALLPNLVFFELIPKIALAPLFIIWLGTGAESRLAFAFFLAFFPILIASTTGLISTDPSLLRLCRALRATWAQTLLQARLPYALPFVFSGIKIGTTMAIIGVIVGEFITGNRGLGYVIMFAASNMETALMLGAMILLCVLGTVVYGTVALLEALVARRFGRPLAT